MEVCSIEGCDRPINKIKKGWCRLHYERWRRHGDPNVLLITYGCKIDGCNREHYGNGFCEVHNDRWRRNGDPLKLQKRFGCEIPECQIEHYAQGYCLRHYYRYYIKGKNEPSYYEIPIIQRFHARTKLNEDNGCIEWNAGKSSGYGVFRYQNKAYLAHRFSYEINKGLIPDGMFICHKCDNRLCINIDHLFIGTNEDNMKDMASKGRGRSRPGETHYLATITDETVLEIRRLVSEGRLNKDIAAELNTTANIVSAIKNGRTWRHVK